MANKGKLGIGSLFGLIFLMVAGVFILQRIWSVNSELRDARSNAAHLERLYDEAMDEAADWRNKYDDEIKKETDVLQEKTRNIETLETEKKLLQQAAKMLQEERKHMEGFKTDIKALLQDKNSLEKEVSRLKEEILKERSKCEKLDAKEINRDAAIR